MKESIYNVQESIYNVQESISFEIPKAGILSFVCVYK